MAVRSISVPPTLEREREYDRRAVRQEILGQIPVRTFANESLFVQDFNEVTRLRSWHHLELI